MKIRTLSKAELAMMYAPNLSVHAAVNRLMARLRRDDTTMQRLHQAGYTKTQKVFSSRQVQIIVDFLGEP